MLDSLITQLTDVLHSRAQDYVKQFDVVLGEIASLKDPACIGRLLVFFEDDAKYDEMMFSIIHTIEMFDDATYVREIAKNLQSFFAKSPRWAIIIHMRIIQSPPSLAAYAEQIKELAENERQIVRHVLSALRRKNAKFEAACDLLLTLAQDGLQ